MNFCWFFHHHIVMRSNMFWKYWYRTYCQIDINIIPCSDDQFLKGCTGLLDLFSYFFSTFWYFRDRSTVSNVRGPILLMHMCLTLPCTLDDKKYITRMVKIVIFMLYVFYHNLKKMLQGWQWYISRNMNLYIEKNYILVS